MRPLYFDHPTDEKLWRYPLQWKLGDDLLVAPVTEPGADAWDIYLPEGEWVDAFTGEAHTGGQVVSRAVPIEELPVYAQASSWEGLKKFFVI